MRDKRDTENFVSETKLRTSKSMDESDINCIKPSFSTYILFNLNQEILYSISIKKYLAFNSPLSTQFLLMSFIHMLYTWTYLDAWAYRIFIDTGRINSSLSKNKRNILHFFIFHLLYSFLSINYFFLKKIYCNPLFSNYYFLSFSIHKLFLKKFDQFQRNGSGKGQGSL